jgi:hypothetical protein
MERSASKVVRIHTKKFLGGYSHALERERINETVLFFAGVFLTVALPQIICIAYGGIIPLIAFASTVSAGSILGWVMYRHAPHRVVSCVIEINTPHAPSIEKAADEKVADEKPADETHADEKDEQAA